jgi:hypothetical protein
MVTERPTRTPLRGFAGSVAECLVLSEAIDTSLSDAGASPLVRTTLGCVFASDEVCVTAIMHVEELGIAPSDIHIGAIASGRADEIARRTGVQADVAPDDPLRDMQGFAGRATARRAVDRAGVWGAAIGALFGFFIGCEPYGHFIPVNNALQPFAEALFFFVIGLFVGSILGAGLAPQQSAHAAFRLIDGMQDGGIGLILLVPAAKAGELASVLETAGASGMTQL